MEFTERKVLVIVRSRPWGMIFNFEGWRAAVGMFGMDHEPSMLFLGDGVYALLKSMDQRPVKMFKSTYDSFDGVIYASAHSLEERKISRDELIDGVEVVADEEMSKLFEEHDISVTF